MANIFSKAIASLGAKIKEINTPFTAGGSKYSLQFNGSGGGLFKKGSYLDEYKNWVYACVNQRAKAVANIDLFLKQDGEIVEDHPVLDLLFKVNKGTTKYNLFFQTQSFKDLDGNAYWFLARDDKKVIQEIHILQPDRMSIVRSATNVLEVAGYVYTQKDGTKIPFDAKDILHFKNFNPQGGHPFPHKGLSIVEAAQWAIDTDNQIRKWNFNFFKNGARPDGILTQEGDGAIDEVEYKRLKEQWTADHQGANNAYKTAILSGGMTWTKVGTSQSELEFAGQKNMNRDEIASIFEVPKFLIGVTESINRATAEAAIYVFTLFTVKPLMQDLVDTLNEFLVAEFGENLELDYKSPVLEDRANIIAEYTAGANVWLSRNEIRAREGLSPTRDGDQFLTPFNLMPQDEVIKAVVVKKPKQKKAKKVKSVGQKAVEAYVAKMPKADGKGMTAGAKEVWKLTWKKLVEKNTKPLVKDLKKYFAAQKDEVLANLKDNIKDIKDIKTKAVLFSEKDAIKLGINLITPHIQEYLKAGGENAAELTGVDFVASTPAIEKFIADRAQYFATTITDTTYAALKDQLKQGMDAGESIDDIADRVAQVYSDAEGYRSEMIARTEVSASQNFGTVTAYEQAGVEKIEWTVVDPEDADCLENEGVEVKIGDAFPSGDTQPPVHPNCVCGTLPVFKN